MYKLFATIALVLSAVSAPLAIAYGNQVYDTERTKHGWIELKYPVKVAPKTVPKVAILEPRTAPAPVVQSSHQLLNLINAERVKRGLRAYTEAANLNASALLKSKDMVKKNYWGHSEDLAYFFRAAGAYYTYMGENLAKCFVADAGVISGWLNSPTHRELMLSTRYTYFGIGSAYNPKDGCTYVSLHMAS